MKKHDQNLEPAPPAVTEQQIAAGRQNLGAMLPVFVYRMMQYNLREELLERFGRETMIDIFRNAGRATGRQFAAQYLDLALPPHEFLADLQQKMIEYKIGILQLEQADDALTKCVLTVREDADCSGLPLLNETVCNYDEGFIAAIFESYTKKPYTAVEIDCWATGARVCRFRCQCHAQDGSE